MNKLKGIPLLFLLVLTLCLLAGCGQQKEAEETGGEDLVYAPSFREIKTDPDLDIQPLCYTENGFYAAVTRYESETKGADTAPTQKLCYVDLDGKLTELDFVGAPAPEQRDELKEYSAGQYLCRVLQGRDGALLALEQVYVSWWDGPESITKASPDYWEYYSDDNSCWLHRMDEKGKVLSSVKLDPGEMENDAHLDLYNAALDGEGRLVVPGEQAVFVFDPEGKLLRTIEMEDWVNRTVLLSDGSLGVQTYGMNGPCVAALDLDKGEVSRQYDTEQWPEGVFSGSGDYAFYFTNGTRLYGFKTADNKAEELLNLLDCDVNGANLQWLQVREDGSILSYSQEEQIDFVELKQMERSSLPEKKVLTLGGLAPESLSDLVLRFNRRHQDIRIQIVDYSEMMSMESENAYQESLDKLNTMIMSGEMPDLLALEAMPYEQLASKGLLEDLYPYLDADPELKREDFLPAVLRAAEIDGKLYQAAAGFQVQTLIGAASVVGEEPGWTISELEEAFAAMPEDCAILSPYSTRDNVLMQLLFADINSYVDWQQGKCDFDNPDFCELLRFCSQFPAEAGFDADESSEMTRIATGKQMLMSCYISSLADLGYNDQYFGGTCTYIGYPARSGCGSYMTLNNGFAMSASCSDKQAAWEFMRLFLSEDYQREQYSLPIRQDVFREQLDEEMRIEYETDENGQFRLDENGERIPTVRGGMGFSDESGGMFSFEYYGLTREQADRFLAMLETIQPMPGVNMKIYDIVKGESGAFFSGERSAEDTAKLIQSKVSLYLAEQH